MLGGRLPSCLPDLDLASLIWPPAALPGWLAGCQAWLSRQKMASGAGVLGKTLCGERRSLADSSCCVSRLSWTPAFVPLVPGAYYASLRDRDLAESPEALQQEAARRQRPGRPPVCSPLVIESPRALRSPHASRDVPTASHCPGRVQVHRPLPWRLFFRRPAGPSQPQRASLPCQVGTEARSEKDQDLDLAYLFRELDIGKIHGVPWRCWVETFGVLARSWPLGSLPGTGKAERRGRRMRLTRLLQSHEPQEPKGSSSCPFLVEAVPFHTTAPKGAQGNGEISRATAKARQGGCLSPRGAAQAGCAWRTVSHI